MFAEWVAGQWEEQIDQVRDSQQSLGRRREGDAGPAGTGEGQGAPPGSEHRRLLTSILSGPSSSPAAALTVLIKARARRNISPLCSIQVPWN